jgi:manganese/zinc/iron transport system permease protein
MLIEALTLQLGYNATLVTLGAALLGMAGGVAGVFLGLRRRALVSDALAHATLPGVALAFMAMVALGGDGRNLAVLMAGSAISAGIGLLAVQALATRTRLPEDAAIGAVLSVFFGVGVVLLTVIQTMTAGKQAGLETFLLGATAGMLQSEAWIIAGGAALTLVCVIALRRPMTLVSFDAGYALTRGMRPARIDLLIMALALAVTVVGLKIVGLVLIVALLIIPPVTARLWTDRVDHLLVIAGLCGGLAGYGGAALSASAAALPTGPLIVLLAFGFFAASLLAAPQRGALARWLRHRRFQRRVHLRQGLLALGYGQPIRDTLTLRVLAHAGLIRGDGAPTEAGRATAALALRDAARWRALARMPGMEALAARHDGVNDIATVLTPDQIAAVDARLAPLHEVGRDGG